MFTNLLVTTGLFILFALVCFGVVAALIRSFGRETDPNE